MKKILTIFLLLTGVLSCHYAIAASTSLTYSYDDHNRLQQVLYGDGSYIEYQYDGIGNIVTATFVGDTDGDGVPNAVDNCPAVANPSQSDVNGNGIGDACDSASDTDNDGLSDAAEVLVYHTSPVSPDSDNDGISDGQEVLAGTDPLVSNNGSFNPDGDFHSGALLDLDVAGGGSQMTRRESLNFHGSVVGSYEVVAASSGGIGQTGEIRILPNPDHTFSVADTDYTGITANDQSVEVLADVVGDGLALKINGKKSSAMTDAALQGDYVFTEMHDVSFSLAPTIVTKRLGLNFNGNGGVDYATLADSAGGDDSSSHVYAVLDDGTLNLLGGTGFITPDGEVIVSVDTTINAGPPVDDNISFGVGVRKGSNMGKGNLFGEFVVYDLGYENHSWSSRSVYTFNGKGGGAFVRTEDSDGQTSGAAIHLTYSVDADGNVSINGQPCGVLSANGQYLVFADTDWNDASPGISMGFGIKTAKVLSEKLGLFRQGTWFLDMNNNGQWDAGSDETTVFGTVAGDKPVAGDWNGDGMTEQGIYRSGTWYLDLNGNGIWDNAATDKMVSGFGTGTDIPVVGDWNGDGICELGFVRDGYWYLDLNGNGAWDNGIDRNTRFGSPTDLPVVGDWNGSGTDSIGVYRQGYWYLDLNCNGVWDGVSIDRQAQLGSVADFPVVGNWVGTGVDMIGVYRQGYWYLDRNGNGAWDGTPVDGQTKFGVTTDIPLVGNW